MFLFHLESFLIDSCAIGGLIVNDLTEAGEFSIDLYTMPDVLTNKLWEHLVSLMSLGVSLYADRV